MERRIERLQAADGPRSRTSDRDNLPGQVVLVLQGGGARGSYQAGVYQALHEAGIEPDWIVGTSIGAINASLIAGNAPHDRLSRLNEFWSRVQRAARWDFRGVLPGFGEKWSYWTTLAHGITGFFTPNPLAHAGGSYPLGPDHAGDYSTAPLQASLSELVDFDLINRGNPRLTVGAAHVRTSHMTYFDSRRCKSPRYVGEEERGFVFRTGGLTLLRKGTNLSGWTIPGRRSFGMRYCQLAWVIWSQSLSRPVLAFERCAVVGGARQTGLNGRRSPGR